MVAQSQLQLFTSIRYDPLLLTSAENARPELSFISPSPFYMLGYHRDRMMEAAQHFDFHEVEQRLQDGKALHGDLLKHVEDWNENHNTREPLKLRILFDRSANMTVEIIPLPVVPLATLYPDSLDLFDTTLSPHPAEVPSYSPLTGGALALGHADALPAVSSTQPPQWNLRLDIAPTCSSPFTLLKTTQRDMYETSRNRALPENAAGPIYTEVMLYNEVNELTEGTLTSLYLFRGGRWVTPPVGVPSGEFNSTTLKENNGDEGELRKPFAGRWGHSVRSAKVGAGGQRGTSRRWALSKGFVMEETVGVDTVSVGERVWVSNGVRGFNIGVVVE